MFSNLPILYCLAQCLTQQNPDKTPPTGPGLGNGVNLQPSFYNGGNVTIGWSLMKSAPKIQTVRIEIEPSVPIELAKSWIQDAVSNGFAVIATYHKYTVLGSNDAGEVTAAADWWKQNYATLREAGEFVVNLINEWGDHTISPNAYATAYNAALKTVREVYDGTVIIDAPGWGQETHTVQMAIQGTDGVKITDPNIVPSLHIYPGAWNQAKNRYVQPSDIDDLATAGRSLIIGEFGSQPAGKADWSGIVAHAKARGHTVLGWAWNGDGAYGMNMAQPAWTDQATATSFARSPQYFDTIYKLL